MLKRKFYILRIFAATTISMLLLVAVCSCGSPSGNTHKATVGQVALKEQVDKFLSFVDYRRRASAYSIGKACEYFSVADKDYRRRIVGMLSWYDTNEVRDFMLRLAREHDSQLSERAIDYLGEHRSQQAYSVLKDLRNDSSSEYQIAALNSLAQYRTQESNKIILDATYDQDVHVRLAAISLLQNINVTDAKRRLYEILKEQSAPIRWTAFKALATTSPREPFVLSYINETGKDVPVTTSDKNEEVVRTLLEIGTNECGPQLVSRLKCASVNAKVQILRFLHDRPKVKVTWKDVESLYPEESQEIRIALNKIIIERKMVEAIPLLLVSAAKGEGPRYLLSIESLSRIGDERARNVMNKSIVGSMFDARVYAAGYFCRMGGNRNLVDMVINELEQMSNSDNWAIREDAGRLCKCIRDPKAASVFKKLKKDPNPIVIHTINL